MKRIEFTKFNYFEYIAKMNYEGGHASMELTAKEKEEIKDFLDFMQGFLSTL